MGHHHSDGSHAGQSNKKVLLFAFVFTALFASLEVIYGFITNSLSLLSEGAHMASDAFSLGLAAFAVALALKGASATKMFGYKRAEPIAAFLNGLGLMIIPLLVVFEAIKRLIYGSEEILSKEMLVVAAIGLLVNLIVAFMLTRGDKENINVRAAALHVIADLLSSVSTIAVSLLIMFFNFHFIDAIASIVISVIIFSGGLKIIKESLNILMEGKPEGLNIDILKKEITDVDGVEEIISLKAWSVAGDEKYLNLHIRVNEKEEYSKVLENIKLVSQKYELCETIQILY